MIRGLAHLRLPGLIAMLALPSCAIEDSHVARQARGSLIGLSEKEVVSCLGVPNRRDRYDETSILTYDGNSTSSGGVSITLPLIGGLSFAGGGFCRATVRLDDGRVTDLRYTGETDATFAPYAYCAPLVRSCVDQPPVRDAAEPAPAPATPAAPDPAGSPAS